MRTRDAVDALPLFTPGFIADPHPGYVHMRRAEPVSKVRMPSGEVVWLVTRYDDVKRVLSNPKVSNDQTKLKIERPFSALPEEVEASMTTDMLNVDTQTHARMRRLIADTFTAHRAEDMRPWVRDKVDQLLDQLAGRASFDVMADYAVPLICQATEEVLGVPRGSWYGFRTYGTQIATTILQRRDEALLNPALTLHDYVLELIALREAKPADDLVTKLVFARDRGELDDLELTSTLHLLLIAGQEGPENLIGSGTFTLLKHPDELALLRADPGLIDLAVEELLRYEAPLGLSVYRWCPEPLKFGDVTIPAGEPILLSLLSSGRDAARFAEPDRINVLQGGHNHLGFGWGAHYCIGAPLGRVEAQEAIGRLFARFPHLRLACQPSEVRWKSSVITRGLVSLPVTVEENPQR